MIAYAVVVAASQMLWLTFAPIDTDVARDFHVSQSAVGWLANVFPLLYVLLALPAGIALDRRFRGSLLLGAGLTALGGLLRLVHQDYAWALVGQLCVAVAQPLVLNSLTKVATGYLPPAQRPAGIALGSAGQFIGAIVALAMGPLLEGRHSLGPLLPLQAGLGLAAAVILAVVLARRAPAEAGPAASIGMAELREVWSLPLSRTLAGLAFVGVGIFVALSTYLQPILHHDHISSTSAGLMLAAMLGAGVVGCGAFPPSVARRDGARPFMIFAVTWVGLAALGLAALHPVVAAGFVLVPAIGLVLLAALPVMLELIEREMGASGGVATGILLLAGNAGGLLVAVLVSLCTGTPWLAFMLLGLVAALGVVPARRLAPPGSAPGRVALSPDALVPAGQDV
ncbi:MAG TPA: MFS transporter [Solirubrobacteraceae bacterium]|nr:MFS transporter [Solirubrobacteraceae bacterium]